MENKNFKYGELTGNVIGCALQVHSHYGSGLLKTIYQLGLEVELKLAGINFKKDYEMPVFYKGKIVSTQKIDFLIEEKLMIRIETVPSIENREIFFAIKNLEIHNIELCLILNFGSKSLQSKRVINKNFLPDRSNQKSIS